MVQSAWIIVFFDHSQHQVLTRGGGSHFSAEDDVLRTEDYRLAGNFVAGVLDNRGLGWGALGDGGTGGEDVQSRCIPPWSALEALLVLFWSASELKLD